MITLDRPLIFFDLETTGLFMDVDRVIELSLLKVHPGGNTTKLTQRFNPEMKIPAESIAIHGIKNEDVAKEPRFADKARELFDLFAGADLGGYGIVRFDVPMIAKEFERAGFVFSIEGRRLVDPSVIFREKERRNLTAAYKFYCGKDLVGAHGAEADITATWEVFLAQMERYEDLPKDVDGLHEFCKRSDPGGVDRQGKLIWRDGQAYFSFGKYRWRALAEVAQNAPDYLDWILAKKDFPADFMEIIGRARKGIYPKKETVVQPED